MKFYNVPLFLLILCFFSCSEKKKFTFTETSLVSTQLKDGVPIRDDIWGLSNFSALQIVDTCLIAFKTGGEESNLFEVYSTNTNKRIGGFGKRGKGPGEYGKYSEMTGQVTFDKLSNKPVICVYNSDEKRLHYVDLYASIKDHTYVSKYEMLPNVGMKVDKIIYKDDSVLYFMPTSHPEARMMKYNLKTQNSKATPYLPVADIPVRKENNWIIFTSFFTVNEESKKIAAAPVFLGQLDFFDFNGEHITSTSFDNPEQYRQDLIAEFPTGTNVHANIVDLKQGKNAIYALNLDVPYGLIRDNLTLSNSKVLKFDWDGKLLKEYVLDQPASSIAIDEAHNRLYIFNPYSEEYSIWYYDLGK